MESVFAVLAEPRRRQILDRLRTGERTVGQLVTDLKLDQPAVSKHLRVLRDAGLVSAQIDGPRRLYRLEPGSLQQIESWIAPYRTMWADRLDALEQQLERIEAEES
jgi:DNA-binding transcriptional ArsR family regulator